MRQFDFYEFTGIIVPGTLALFGIAVTSPAVKFVVFNDDMTVGDAAVSLILAYGAGHLIQALGNGIESLLWKAHGGWPSDWPRSGAHPLISSEQVKFLMKRLRTTLNLDLSDNLKGLNPRAWHSIVRQVYAAVSRAGSAQRIDTFNGNYGLNRGIAAALLLVGVGAFVVHGRHAAGAAAFLALGVAVAIYRMHRFGVHYARELFVQFLNLKGDALTPKINGV